MSNKGRSGNRVGEPGHKGDGLCDKPNTERGNGDFAGFIRQDALEKEHRARAKELLPTCWEGDAIDAIKPVLWNPEGCEFQPLLQNRAPKEKILQEGCDDYRAAVGNGAADDTELWKAKVPWY